MDDHATNRMKLSMAVFQLGHHVDLAEDGVQALELLRSQDIDLVLLDILMPQMDGTTVLLHMQSDVELRDIPVIVISAVDEMESVVAGIERGAEDYLPKDFDPVLLEARVNACLEKKRLRDTVDCQLNFIQDIFGKYVPESVVKSIMEAGGLKPARTIATILFIDIEGFATIVENLPPEEAFASYSERGIEAWYYRRSSEKNQYSSGSTQRLANCAGLSRLRQAIASYREAVVNEVCWIE
ncbi:MAG: response regulator [bacterium]